MRRRVAAILAIAVAPAGCGTGAGDPAGVPPAPPWFTEITSEAGIDFVHESGGRGGFLMPEIMGAGCALFDCDGDGDLDVYLLNGNRLLPAASVADGPGNRLYRQVAPGQFVDATSETGLADGGYGMGACTGDYDNDGDLDLFVTNYGPDRLYRNDGGVFTDVTAGAGITVDGWSASAVFFDYGTHGFLDLFVTRYVDFHPEKLCYDQAGRRDYCGPTAFKPVPDVLLHNEGDGTFTDRSAASRISSVAAAGLGVVTEDFNDDGRPDLYVANDAYANHLWINRGNGTFFEEAIARGAAYNLHGQAQAGMGVIASDLDHDGRLDLFVTHLGLEANTFYRNVGAGNFIDDTGASNLGVTSMQWTGFGTWAFDAELDGDLDLAVANGRVTRGTPVAASRLLTPWDLFPEPNLFYLNDGRGRFSLAGGVAPSLCDRLEITRGMACGDLDSDGDVDLLVTNCQGPARLYRNDAPRKGRWLIVRALDPRFHRDSNGARITVVAGGRTLIATAGGGGSYLSACDHRAHFGLGNVTSVERVEVRWPDGVRERFAVRGLDRAVTLGRGGGEQVP